MIYFRSCRCSCCRMEIVPAAKSTLSQHSPMISPSRIPVNSATRNSRRRGSPSRAAIKARVSCSSSGRSSRRWYLGRMQASAGFALIYPIETACCSALWIMPWIAPLLIYYKIPVTSPERGKQGARRPEMAGFDIPRYFDRVPVSVASQPRSIPLTRWKATGRK